jgi:hypothetical protein
VSGFPTRRAGGGTVRFPIVQTRYLLIASLVTALAIVGASVVWFVMAFS